MSAWQMSPRDRVRTCSSPRTSLAPLHHPPVISHKHCHGTLQLSISVAIMWCTHQEDSGEPFINQILFWRLNGSILYVVTTVSVSYCHDGSSCQTNICVDCPRLLMSGHTGGDKMQPQHFLYVCTLGTHTHYTTTITHSADCVWRFVGGEQRRRSVGLVFVFISML